jgi:acyl-CoA thioester hydrolase
MNTEAAPTAATRPSPEPRSAYAAFRTITTRWMDNDVYGHVNNVVYYSFFDTAVNKLLVEAGVLDVAGSEAVGLVVQTSCTYFESIAFPDAVEIGVWVERIGRSSVTYQLAVFRAGEGAAAALGSFTHVYVERASQRPVPMPDKVRHLLASLLRP